MKGRIFVDTNILIYAHDLEAGSKHELATAILKDLWNEHTGVISTQVLQEFYVNVTRKIRYPLTPAQARSIIENYLVWHIEENGSQSVLKASRLQERYGLSFWDSLIVVAAAQARTEKLLTEDLQHGQKIEGVLIENPFFVHA